MALTQISTAGVKDNAVTSGKIPANAVGSSELADNAVDTAAIADDAVTAGKLADDIAINTTGTITTSDDLICKDLAISDTTPSISFTDTDNNPDFKITANSGALQFTDATNSNTNRLVINSDGHVDVTGNLDVGAGIDCTGTCTATSFAGDGSNLTGITSTTINNNADNRVITGSGTANTLEGESNLTFNGTKLSLTPPANTGNDGLEIIPAGGSTASSFKVRGNQSAGVAAGRNGGVVEIDANYYAATSDIFTIKSRGSTVLNMYGNGNLGLGTASPSANLHLKVDQQTAKMITLNGDDARNNYIGINGGDNLEIAADEDAAGSASSIRFRVDGSERMRLDSDGLKFNGDTAAANALDDYEEGTFTPQFNSGSSSGACYAGGESYSSQVGVYRKVGHVVHFIIKIQVSSGTLKSGILQINNLPFTTGDFSSYSTAGGAQYGYSTGYFSGSGNRPTMYVSPGNSVIQFFTTAGNNYAGTSLNAAAGRMDIFGHYFTS